MRRISKIHSLKKRVRKLEEVSPVGWEKFDLVAHFTAFVDYRICKAFERGYTEQESDDYAYWLLHWCFEVARGVNIVNGFKAISDPFLWDKFEPVWDDAIEHFGRMPTRTDSIRMNDVNEYLERKAREYSETWEERIKNLKKPILCEPSTRKRLELERERIAKQGVLNSVS